MIKAVIFDFDGVIADSEHVNIEGGVQAFKEIGHDLDDDDKQFIVARDSRAIVSHIMRSKGISASEDELVERYRQLYDDLWETGVRAMPAIQNTLHALEKKDLVFALATSNRRSRVESFLKQFELTGIFSIIVGGEKVAKKKPDPEVYLKTLEELGLPASVVLTVEDSSVGLRAAKAAGLRCAVIPNKHTAAHDFSSADFILKSPEELLDIVSA